MSEKDDETAEWVIESFVQGVGWSFSRLNEDAEAHTLTWCIERWNLFKQEDAHLFDPFWNASDDGLTTHPDRYRLRNVRTESIIMGAIL